LRSSSMTSALKLKKTSTTNQRLIWISTSETSQRYKSGVPSWTILELTSNYKKNLRRNNFSPRRKCSWIKRFRTWTCIKTMRLSKRFRRQSSGGLYRSSKKSALKSG
jgi:hypothetical protein